MSSKCFHEEMHFSDEYLDYLCTEIQYDSQGRYIDFKGVQYCQNNDQCRCEKCRERKQFQHWPYERSLARILFSMMTNRLDFYYKTDEEFIQYEQGLLIDYRNDFKRFEQYVEHICMMNNDFGMLIFNDFKSGRYRKRFPFDL